MHVLLQETFEECEGEPEVPPAETQRAPTFRTSTSTQSATTGDDELGQAEAKGAWGLPTSATEKAKAPPTVAEVQKRVRVTGAEGGPWPSGDGEAVEQLNLQDLHDLQAQDFATCD